MDPDLNLPEGYRAIGFDRYRELLNRDWKTFWIVGFLTLLLLAPAAAGIALALLSSSILVLIPACIVGGAIAGPGLAGMYDAVYRSLRNAPTGWWYNYRQAWKQNWRGAIVPGMVQTLLTGLCAFACLIWWSAETLDYSVLVLILVSALLVTLIFQIYWPQLVLFRQSFRLRMGNIVLFTAKYLWRCLGVAALQLGWLGAAVVLLPWSAFVVPILGVWYPLFLSNFLLYRQLDEAFEIEDQLLETFPDQVDSV
ncbi:MAG: hypothetical protein LUH51_07965 [Firmicutes bacterium]|nr:hypothetical protein [Bacillota bacterium]